MSPVYTYGIEIQQKCDRTATECESVSLQILGSSNCKADTSECAKNTEFILRIVVSGREIFNIPASVMTQEQLTSIWEILLKRATFTKEQVDAFEKWLTSVKKKL